MKQKSRYAVGTVSTYKINNDNGLLTPESTISTNYLPISITISDDYAYVVNLLAESDASPKSIATAIGRISTYKINNGILTPVSTENTGYAPTAISISNNYAYVTNALGNSILEGVKGSVWTYKINNGILTPVSTVDTGNLPSAINILGDYAYVTNSLGNTANPDFSISLGSISTYKINNGILTPISNINTEYCPSGLLTCSLFSTLTAAINPPN
jgi:6-phosphogluconolactonase (cycloisomerase 2 family)